MNAIETKKLNLYYGAFHALKNVTCNIAEKCITALIGPSGCGKSTLLRVFNRMNDLIDGVKIDGDVAIFGRALSTMDVTGLRRAVGMVFQRPNPFPLSVFENLAFGPRVHGESNRSELSAIAERSLRDVGLWDAVKDKLNRNALSLTMEEQQRLCIARLLAVKPNMLLMDEPCSTLDPIATARIEALMQDLKKDYSIIIVTHNMQQAARVSDDCGFMLLGELVEIDKTNRVFTAPHDKKTEDYISGRYG